MLHRMKLAASLSLVALAAGAELPLARRGPVFPKDLPFAGLGKCEEPVKGEDGFTRVKCWGPLESLKPGETRNVMVELANPYNSDSALFSVVNMTGELVDEDLRPVPLSEVYVHHYVSRNEFLQGSGAELRGSFTRAPLEWPLTLQVNGSVTAQHHTRITNVQLINTVGVAAADLPACTQCWCWDTAGDDGLPTKGSFLCCSNCPTTSTAPARGYQLQLTVTYRTIEEAEEAAGSAAQPVAFLGFDSTGGRVEYDLLEPLGPGTTHHQVMETTVDEQCPQEKPFTIVRCTAHQHVASRCLSVYNMDKGDELICRSCPVEGTEEGVPGNERGYVVAMTDDNVAYEVAPGTRIRVDSAYDGSQRRLGMMGLMAMWVTGLDEAKCAADQRYNSGAGHAGHSHGYASPLTFMPYERAAAAASQPALTAV